MPFRLHLPLLLHISGHTRREHESPTNPRKQKHVPSLHAPWFEQSFGHERWAQSLSLVYPLSQMHVSFTVQRPCPPQAGLPHPSLGRNVTVVTRFGSTVPAHAPWSTIPVSLERKAVMLTGFSAASSWT